MDYILPFLVVVPFITGIIIMTFSQSHELLAKQVALVVSLVVFVVSLVVWILFDSSTVQFQYVYTLLWMDGSSLFSLGLDGVSVFFVLLTTFLIPLCLLASWEMESKSQAFNLSWYFAAFLILESFILVVFLSLDLLLFYTFFEAVLIPMFIVVGIWGSRERKIRAAYFLFLYTLLGSLLMLLGILIIYFEVGSFDYLVLVDNCNFSFNRQSVLWFAFFVAFAVKIPMVPVHIWLPEAHVEAPTAGSVLLAGILLKLGSYGMIRYSLVLFPAASLFFRPFVFVLAIVAVVYTSLTALRQSDIKRVIAYASVAHINTTLVGLFSFNQVGFEGALFQIISHGLVSGALFLCVGVLYDRHHSRIIKYYSGITQTIPLFVFIFLFFTIANIAFPGTSSFIGEFLIFAGAFSVSKVGVFFTATGMFLGGGYSLWLFNRIAYGNFKTLYLRFSYDLTRREFYVFLPLLFSTLFFGIFPFIFFDTIHISSTFILERVVFYLLKLFYLYYGYSLC